MSALPSPFKVAIFMLLTVVLTTATESKLIPSDWTMDDSFGRSVAIDGNTAVVGVPLDDNVRCHRIARRNLFLPDENGFRIFY